MYNGVGLPSARGSGTNAYVQKNNGALRSRDAPFRGAIEDSWKGQSDVRHRKPDAAILDHERKRKIEVACVELEDELESQGVGQADIESKVAELRERLNSQQTLQRARGDVKNHETHELAAIKARENEKMARAFGINSDFKEGMSFDREAQAERIAKEKAEREERRSAATQARENRAALDALAAQRKEDTMARIQQRNSERKVDHDIRWKDKDLRSPPARSSNNDDRVQPRSRRSISPPPRDRFEARSSGSRDPYHARGRDHSRSPSPRRRRRSPSSERRHSPPRSLSRSRSPMVSRRPLEDSPHRGMPRNPRRRRSASPRSDMSVSD